MFEWLNTPKNVSSLAGVKVSTLEHPFINIVHRSSNMCPNAIPVNLTVFKKEQDGVEQWHYVLINNMNRFQNYKKKHGYVEINIQEHWCNRCLRAFNSAYALDSHKPLCLHFLKFGPITYKLSTYSDLEFCDWQRIVPPSYIAIADFESVLQPANDQISTTNTL